MSWRYDRKARFFDVLENVGGFEPEQTSDLRSTSATLPINKMHNSTHLSSKLRETASAVVDRFRNLEGGCDSVGLGGSLVVLPGVIIGGVSSHLLYWGDCSTARLCCIAVPAKVCIAHLLRPVGVVRCFVGLLAREGVTRESRTLLPGVERLLLGDAIHLWWRSESSVEVVSWSEGRPAPLVVGVGVVGDEGVSKPNGGCGRHVERLQQGGCHEEMVRLVQVGAEDVI